MDKYKKIEKLLEDLYKNDLDEHLAPIKNALKRSPTRDVVITYTALIDTLKKDGNKISTVYKTLNLDVTQKTFSEYLYIGRKKLKEQQKKKPSLMEKLHLVQRTYKRVKYEMPTEETLEDWNNAWAHIDLGAQLKNRLFLYQRIALLGLTPQEIISWKLNGSKVKHRIGYLAAQKNMKQWGMVND
jgi:Fe2+ or Zn2+ uptake regulation protein